MPAGPKAGTLPIFGILYLMLGHHLTCYVDDITKIHVRNEASQAAYSMLGSIRNVLCHEAFDRRWSVYAWPGQVNAWKDLAVSGQCPVQSLHRRMRLKLLPETLVRDELLQRDDLESLGTAKRSTTRALRENGLRRRNRFCSDAFCPSSEAKMHLEYNGHQRARFLTEYVQRPAKNNFQPRPKHLASPQPSVNLLEDV